MAETDYHSVNDPRGPLGDTTATVSVIVVSFNSEATLEEALQCVPGELETIVVEQSVNGRASDVARRARPGTRVIQSGSNRGFGAGCNLGAANALGDVLVFLNPDASLEHGTFQEMAAAVVARRGAIVGPLLRDEDGEDITRARTWTTPWKRAVHLLVPRRLQPRRWAIDIPESDPRYVSGDAVPYLQGACFAVGRATFFEAGGFNENLFLYGEEEYLARQLRSQGLASHVIPSCVVRHIGHTSTESVGAFATQQLFRSTVLGYRMYQGRCGAIAGAALLLGVLGILSVTSPVRRRIGYRPDFDAGWCREAARGILAGIMNRPVRPPLIATAEGCTAWR